jgi:2-polyprenyl-3-methyl-5-hydroxy-6-metoxy-1,4-benzoquinol methylase
MRALAKVAFMTDESYHTYESFKSWSSDPDDSHDRFFSMEVAPLNLAPGARMVEIGFGEGRFLDYAKRAGFEAVGIEIIPSLVERAKARGLNARIGRLTDLIDQAGSFDMVTALDLIEHLATDEIRKFLFDSASLLKKGGFVFLRFPNGSSPFSLALYNGDVTHRSYLNVSSLAQLASPAGLRLVRYGNAARDLPDGLMPRIRRRISYAMRSVIETLFGLAYFGKRIPMDANLVIILQK